MTTQAEGNTKKLLFNSAVSVFEVSDIKAAIAWYAKWFGQPDATPMENMAEYKLTDTAWLQLTVEDSPEPSKGSLILGIEDARAYRSELIACGIEVGEIIDWGVVLVFDIHDPDGNRISFAQEQ